MRLRLISMTFSLLLAVLAARTAPVLAAAPANDSFANATTITGSSGALSASNVDATTETGEPNLATTRGSDTGTGTSVWYTWTAPSSGQFVFNTRGSGFDTTLGVFTGSSVGGLTTVAFNDDIVENTSQSSQITFTATAGTTYSLQVGGFNSLSGTFQLIWGAPVASSSSLPADGWWWNASESGRGYSLAFNGNNIFMATYMYRSSGTAVWYVGTGTLSGSTATLTFKEYTGGQTVSGSYQAASELGTVALGTLTFSSTMSATLSWSGGGLTSSIAAIEIVRYPFDGQSVQSAHATPYPDTGWYWSASEPGTGYFIENQGSQIFMAAYMYGADGTARWYAASGTPVISGPFLSFSASLVEYSGGQSLGGSYRAPTTQQVLGQVSLSICAVLSRCPPGSTTMYSLGLPGGRTVALSRFTSF